MIAAVLLGVGGAAAGFGLHVWLRGESYRYDDERDLPSRSTRWLVPVLAAAAAVLGLRLSGEPGVLAVMALALVWMAGLAAIDIDVRRLPDRWTLPGLLLWPLLLAGCALAADDWSRWGTALLCGLAHGAAYLLLAVLNPAGLGLGDVKLAVPLGVLVGWWGWAAVFGAFFAAFALGLVIGLIVAVRSGEGRKATFPFGPAMLLGAYVVILAVA